MRGRIVSLDDGSLHLVTDVSAHAAKGRMLTLFPLGGGQGAPRKVPVSQARILRDSTKGGEGAMLRALLANRRSQEGGGVASL